MAAAKPIPLPTVEPTPRVVDEAGVPHAGKGEAKAGGRPENDEAKGYGCLCARPLLGSGHFVVFLVPSMQQL
jgi:hypothetical protein